MLLPQRFPPHPRLLADPGDWSRLHTQAVKDETSRRLYATLQRRAEAILRQPLLERQMTGRMLLMTSREALERLSVLSLVACVSGDRRLAVRAEAELLAVCAFADWNPSHFLDTAEMALGVSIAYDWLHPWLHESARSAVETALIDKALIPSLDERSPANWWLHTDENWVQVCHGGLAAAAIVLADRVPELSKQVLQRALTSLPAVAAGYAPDGAYPEGPMYWSYGTAYQVTLAAALHRLTGSTQGVDAYPGFTASADYIAQVTAPSGDYFNYSDCAAGRRLQAQLFWLARQHGRSDWLWHDIAALERDLAEYEAEPDVQYWYYDMVALALLWYQPADLVPPAAPKPFWHGRGATPVALYRWGAEAFYLGVKGGSVGVSHSHMDLGTFIFEAGGVRWALDTGMQDYDSLESAGVDLWNERDPESQRWDVFRIGPESHNILRFDGEGQRLFRKAEIVDATEGGCTVDLGSAYGDSTLATRRFDLWPEGFVMLDTWRSERARRASWQWLTCAGVKLTGSGVILSQHNRRVQLTVTASPPGELVVEDVSGRQRAYDHPNPGLSRICLRCPCASEGTITVTARLLPLAEQPNDLAEFGETTKAAGAPFESP